jgi:hypothetical protein
VNKPVGPRPGAPEDPLPRLRDDFPQFRIWREHRPGRIRYVARRVDDGVRPHTLVTGDPAELRRELATNETPARD